MYPHERSLVKRLAGKPFVLLGVNSDTDREALKKAIEKEKITWRSWLDGGKTGAISSKWHVRGWPTLYVLDATGTIRNKYEGSPGDQVLDRVLDNLLRETEAAPK